MRFFDFIAVFGLVQAVVIAILIFTNKVFRNDYNKYFAYFLILLAFIGLDSTLSHHYNELGYEWALFLDVIGDDIPWIMLMYLPLFQFFLKSIGSWRPGIPIWVLTLPFFLFTIFNGVIDLDLEFGLISAPFFNDNRLIIYQLEDYVAGVLFLSLHTFVFFKTLKNKGSKWIKRLWWYSTALLIVWMILILDQTFFDDLFFRGIEIILWSLVTVFVYWLMYTGLFQFNLAHNRQEIRSKLTHTTPEDTPRRTGLSVKSKAYFDQLMELMIIDKVYRNPDLGRETVAEELGISVSYLTQLIKEYTDKNLASFINEFRVEEVKKMLKDPAFDNYDHLSIGLEAGFQSKSTYYTTFKNLTGKTPAQFKKES